MDEVVLAIDPGTDKCGLAAASQKGVLRQWVAPRERLFKDVKEAVEVYGVRTIILGDGTGSKKFEAEISAAFPEISVAVVDEYRTTDAARERYWREKPPKGWRRLLPVGMQVPPEPYDDLVAVILAERYFENRR